MLRTQTIRGTKTVWLSPTDDDASFKKLNLLKKGKQSDANSFVRIEKGTQVYITELTTKRCQGRNVFVKVQVKDGDRKGLEGWICGASTTHHKVIPL